MAHHDAAKIIVQFDSDFAVGLSVPAQGETTPSRLMVARDGGLHELATTFDMEETPWYSILPRHEATLRILTLPSHDTVEIESMVRLGASDLVPYPIEEMLISHQVLAQLPTGESRVLVVLVRHETIRAYIAALTEAGREPAEIFLSTACLVAAAAAMDGFGERALLHLDQHALELAAVQEGELLFSRGIAQAARWDLDNPRDREALAYEVRELLAAYRREGDDGQGADVIYVSATGFPAGDVMTLVAEATGKECRAIPTGIQLADCDMDCPATLSGALRLAAGKGPLNLALTPPGLGRQRAMKRFQTQLLHGLALVCIMVLALGIWYGEAVWQRNRLIAELQSQVDAIAPGAQGVAAKQHGLQIISRQVDKGPSFLELLAGIAASAPPSGLNIARIQYERESGLNLWGRALTKDLVLKDFLGALRTRADGELALFSGAHSLYETAGIERDQPVINYQITVPLLEEDSARASDDR